MTTWARGSFVCRVLHKTTCHVYLTCLERLPTYFLLDNLQLSSCTLLTRSEKDDIIKRTSRPLLDGNVASTTFVSFRFLLVLSNPPLHCELWLSYPVLPLKQFLKDEASLPIQSRVAHCKASGCYWTTRNTCVMARKKAGFGQKTPLRAREVWWIWGQITDDLYGRKDPECSQWLSSSHIFWKKCFSMAMCVFLCQKRSSTELQFCCRIHADCCPWRCTQTRNQAHKLTPKRPANLHIKTRWL